MEKYLEFFYEIAAIPHGSHNTEAIADYLTEFAQKRNLYTRKDAAGNVVIIKKAHKDYVNHAPVILQGHTDMVAVKEKDCLKDMKNEGLELYVDADNSLRAKGTSLGADDGIAVAYMLSLLDGDYRAPEMQCIFTANEEVGMLGADAFNPFDITGRRMINLDQEDEGVFVAGCAGGAHIDMHFKAAFEPVFGNVYTIGITGLKGGHSGVDIDKKGQNAIKVLADELCKLKTAIPFNLISISGGEADNAIAKFASAVIAVPSTAVQADEGTQNIMSTTTSIEHRDFMSTIMALKQKKLCFDENDTAYISVNEEGLKDIQAMSDSSTTGILDFLEKHPYGVVQYSRVNPDMVETSLNPGTVVTQNDEVRIGTLVRSGVDEERDTLIDTLCKLTIEHSGTFEIEGKYSGWEFKEKSELRELLSECYERVNLCKPTIRVIHAGLECGIFEGKIENLDCISIGPQINNIHTTEENLPLKSATDCFEFLKEVLENM